MKIDFYGKGGILQRILLYFRLWNLGKDADLYERFKQFTGEDRL